MVRAYSIRDGLPVSRTVGLNANMLKLIAIAAMAVQHVTIKFVPGDTLLSYFLISVGKITAPIMCFFIAEGYFHTGNRRRYLKRLFLFSLVSHVPHALAFGLPVWMFWKYTSVMWSLTLGLAALMIYYHSQWSKWLRFLGILGCCILAYPGNWNCVAVIWILGFGIFRDKPAKKWAVFLLGIAGNIIEFFVVDNESFLLSNLAFLVPALLLNQYNGQYGRKNKLVQRFFYWFYPAHLLLIYGVYKLWM